MKTNIISSPRPISAGEVFKTDSQQTTTASQEPVAQPATQPTHPGTYRSASSGR
jgi:hypothetical protein